MTVSLWMKAAKVTTEAWPHSSPRHCPVRVFHMRMMRSFLSTDSMDSVDQGVSTTLCSCCYIRSNAASTQL